MAHEPDVAPSRVEISDLKINICKVSNPRPEEMIKKQTRPCPTYKPQKAPLEYQGASGRPLDSLEQLFINTPLEYSPAASKENNSIRNIAAHKIQNCLRFWSTPRWRARRYNPRTPETSRKYPPGATRLPGYELSTREAAALHHLIENGRIGELTRSLAQLEERGTQLTEKSLLPISILARQLGEPYASRAILEFAEHHDVLRSGRLYSETVLTVLENISREDAEAVAWRAAKKGYLLTAIARTKLEESGSYTSAQWRAHWQLQVLKSESTIERRPCPRETRKPTHSRALYAVMTRRRGHALEVLSLKGQSAPFHQFESPTSHPSQYEPLATALPKASATLPTTSANIPGPPEAVQSNPSIGQALVDAVKQCQEGHAYCQWKSLATPLRTGQCRFPKGGMARLLRPAETILENLAAPTRESSFEASAWHVEVRPGTQLFRKPTAGYEWIPLDDAVWALGEADPLQLWRHLLIQTTKHPGAVAAHHQAEMERTPISLPRVVIVCEESLSVNSHIQATNHAVAMSVDLLPPEYDGPRHLTGEATDILHLGWDLLIGFPPCQHLCNSSALYLPRPGRRERLKTAAAFFKKLLEANVPAIALENPKMHPEACAAIGGVRPSQTIHPHMHACEVTKPTNLYLLGLPLLKPSCVVPGRMHSISALPQGPLRAMIKGRTFDGIARAMAQQWIPVIAAARLQQEECKVSIAVRHRLDLTYGQEGALNGPRPDWSAVRHFQRESTVIAAIMEVSSRNQPGQVARRQDWCTVAASRTQKTVPEPPARETVFAAWKRHAELGRGGIFGVAHRQRSPLARQLSAPEEKSRWLDAQRVVREHLLDRDHIPHPTITIPASSSPIPPIRRIHRRFGSWWLWTPIPGTGGAPPRHEWRKLPYECQAILEEAAAGLRPKTAKFRQQQAEPSSTLGWRRLARGLRLRTASFNQFRESRATVASLLPNVARTIDDVCSMCGRPRAGADPCPRGLGASSCAPSTQENAPIQFVKETAASRVCTVTNPFKAKNIISKHARSWRLQKHRQTSAIGQALPLDKRICTAHGLGEFAYHWDRGQPRPRPPRVRLNEKLEPELIKLQLPDEFGEDTVSNTPRLPPHHQTHCAWLKDVLISTHNTGQKRLKAPYLVGRACAWSPAAMGDSGAAISLIGTELLKNLPPDAVVKFRWSQGQVSQNVCGPNGEPLAILGEVDLLLTISRIPFRHKFQIVLGGDLLLMGADFMAPREGDVCPRVDTGDGISGFCTLNHPTYGRVRLPLATDPALPPQKQTRVASVAPETHKAATMPQHHLLFNVTAFRVAPRSERELLLRLPDRLQDPPCDEPLLVKPLADYRGLDPNVRVAYSLSRPRKPEGSNDLHVPVRVLNLASTAVSIPALSPLAEMEIGSEATDQDEGPTFTPEEIQKISEELVIDPDGILSQDERRQVDELVKRRLGAFAQDSNAPSQTHAIEVHLPLKEGAMPHRHAPPRLGVEGRRFVRENVAEMERRGIVYKTQSPWGSRIVLVRKKDGTLRQCIDYRDLNSKLLVQDSPLPRIDTCLEAMTEGLFNEQIAQLKKEAESPLQGAPADLNHTATVSEPAESTGATEAGPLLSANTGSMPEPDTGKEEPAADHAEVPKLVMPHRNAPRFWCTMDLASGFHGIPIAPESQPQTAFVTPDGKYAYTRLPFGLQCAPSYMVNLMNEVMQGLQWSICVCYMDDTLVWAQDFEEMMERLELVLERFIGANLSLKAKKCTLFATTVDFLGFRLSSQGIGVSPEKVETIRRINPEAINNITAVRSFLGAASFYRKHIRGFAAIAKPLTELTRQGVDVATESQKEGAQKAIHTLKEALTTAPVLAMPRWDRPFIVHTDACITGLGAVLCQRDEEETERPVAYWGRVLTPAEANYNVSELELLAIICCIKQWRPYLWSASGKKFILRVDHAALLYLHTAKDTVGGGPASRLQRWYLKLQEYRFEVWHRPGRIHYDADFISRMQGNPEYAKLTREVDTPEWAKVSDESTRRHTSALSSGSTNPENQTGLATSGGAALKEGEGVLNNTENINTESPKIPATDPEVRKVIALVGTGQEPAGNQVNTSTPTTDLSVQETLDLLAALEARLPVDERPAALEKLGMQLRKGRQIRIATLEAILVRLREQGLGLRAAELAEVMMSANRISKKALYIALAATHGAGLCLQSAPLQRALSTDFNIRSAGAKKMLQALELEFDGSSTALDETKRSDRLIHYVHIVITAMDGLVFWGQRPTYPGSNAIKMSASKKCESGRSLILTARGALREAFTGIPPVLVSALDDQLKLFPMGQARARLSGDSPWHKESQHFCWLVPLHPPDPYELQPVVEKDTEKPSWFPLKLALKCWYPAIANAVAKAQRRHRDTNPKELQAQYQMVRGDAGESLPVVQSLRRSLNSLVASCVTWEDWNQLNHGRWASAKIVNGEASPSARRIAAANAHRSKSQPHLAQVNDCAARARQVWSKYAAHDVPHSEEIRREQQSDLWCSEIMEHLISEAIPTQLTGPAITRFVATASEYTLREGLLFKYQRDPRAHRNAVQLAVPVTLRTPFMEAFHERAGHPGIERSYQALRQRAYWPGMREAMVQHVAECHECAMAKKPCQSFGTTILPGVPSRPFDTIYADVLTLPESTPVGPNRLVYSKLLIFCDALTRWVEAIPLPSEPTSEEIIEAFIENIVSRFGVPRCLVCDRGSNLISKLCQEVYELLGVDMKPSTSYHHNTSGLVERYNRTLAGLLRATGQDGADWPLHVPWLNFLFRATPHEVTKESPAFLALGRELRTPADLRIFAETDPETTATGQPSTIDTTDAATEADVSASPHAAHALKRRLEIAWDAAAHLSRAAQMSSKERRDLSRREPVYQVGDQVLVRRPVNDHTGVPEGGKLAPIYEGPYRVSEILDNGNVQLRDMKSRGIYDVFHVTRLRPYLTYTTEVPLEEDEYIVEKILARRGEGENREYLIKWKGYSSAVNGWEPQAHLMRHCMEEVTAFDTQRDAAARPRQAGGRPPRDSTVAPTKPQSALLKETQEREERLEKRANRVAAPVRAAAQPAGSSEEAQLLTLAARPKPATAARLIAGTWHYQCPQGNAEIWVDQRFFSPLELESMRHLQSAETQQSAPTPPTYHQTPRRIQAMVRRKGISDLYATRYQPENPVEVRGVPNLPAGETRVVKFALTSADGHIFSWIRAESVDRPAGPHVDLPGGKARTGETLIQAAHRELAEELGPYGPNLQKQIETALEAYPQGHSYVRMRPPTGDGIHHVMVWGINVYGTEQLTAKETSKHLEARWRTPLEVWPSFQEGRAPYGKAVRQAWEIVRSRDHPTTQHEPEDPSQPSDDPLSHCDEKTEVPPWMALSLPHRPDVTLLRKSQLERELSESTACALAIAVQASQQPLAVRVEELKNRLLQPNPSWLDYNHWLLAMGKLYRDPKRGTVSRLIRPKVSLQWRAERLNIPINGHPPLRVAHELRRIMEDEASKRSTAICATDTKPHKRKQLLEQEELLAQAYHYLATRPK